MSGRRRGFVRGTVGGVGLESRRGRVGGGQFGAGEPRRHFVTFFCGAGVARRRDDRKPSVGPDEVFRHPKSPREQHR